MIYALHGMMGHYRDWEGLGLNLKAVDLWQEENISDFENWSSCFSGSVEVEKNKLLAGYSMGGRLALHAVLENPKSWKGAVVLSAHPGLVDDLEKEQRLKNDHLWAERAKEMPWQDFCSLWNGQAVLAGNPGSLHQAELEQVRCRVAEAFEYWSLGKQADLRPALADCSTPVLWITGERDEKFTCLAEEVTAENSCFEHKVVPGAGHRLLSESEDALKLLRQLIEDFQKRIL